MNQKSVFSPIYIQGFPYPLSVFPITIGVKYSGFLACYQEDGQIMSGSFYRFLSKVLIPSAYIVGMHALFVSSGRLLYFVFSTLWHTVEFGIATIQGRSRQEAGIILRRKWLSHVPSRLGIELKLKGIPHHDTCLFVANHIGYIDPFAVLMHVNASVVAKAEILRWPFVGFASYLVGTIFVDRDVKDSRFRAADMIRKSLEEGTSVLVFPEGTTTNGNKILPFRPRAFLAAHLAGVPVQPVALFYDRAEVAFIGSHTFLPHFIKLFKLKKIKGTVVFGPLLTGDNTHEEAKNWIETALSSRQLNYSHYE